MDSVDKFFLTIIGGLLLVVCLMVGSILSHSNKCKLNGQPNAQAWVNNNYPSARLNPTQSSALFDVITSNGAPPFSIWCGCNPLDTCQLYVSRH